MLHRQRHLPEPIRCRKQRRVPESALPLASTSSRQGTVCQDSILRGPVDVRTPAVGGTRIRLRLVSICLRTARMESQQKTLWMTVLEKSSLAQSGAKTAPRWWSCLSTRGAASRFATADGRLTGDRRRTLGYKECVDAAFLCSTPQSTT